MFAQVRRCACFGHRRNAWLCAAAVSVRRQKCHPPAADSELGEEPVVVREEKSEMAVTVGADGFSYTHKEDDGHTGDKTGFKLGAQL